MWGATSTYRAASYAATASKSVRTRARETPRGYRPACHSARASGETDSARQTCARRPTAIGPVHCRVSFGGRRAAGGCGGSEDRAGLPARRMHGRPAGSRDGNEGVLAFLEVLESHRRATTLLANHVCWHRSGETRAARPGRRKSDDAWFRVWPDQWDLDRSGRAPHTARMEQLSTTARDQSIWSPRASHSSSAK